MSTASSSVSDAIPDPFLASLSQTPALRSTLSANQDSNSAASRKAITSAAAASDFFGMVWLLLDDGGQPLAPMRCESLCLDLQLASDPFRQVGPERQSQCEVLAGCLRPPGTDDLR